MFVKHADLSHLSEHRRAHPEADFTVEPAQGLQPSGVCKSPTPWACGLLSLSFWGSEQILVHPVQTVFTGGMSEGQEHLWIVH